MSIYKLPINPEVAFEVPKRIMRPCDYALLLAIRRLETEVGTIEAYNRLAEAAQNLKAKIEESKAVAQNPCYANVTAKI